MRHERIASFFFFNDTATTEIYTLSLHDALPIYAKAYLFRCVRNAVLNDRKARQRDVVLDPECAWFEPPNRDYAAELNLRRALWGLPEDQREVTILHVWGELTFAQIAEVLGISANTDRKSVV